MNPTVNEVKNKLHQLENKIQNFITSEIMEFQNTTGIVPDIHVSIQRDWIHSLGQYPTQVLSRIKVEASAEVRPPC